MFALSSICMIHYLETIKTHKSHRIPGERLGMQWKGGYDGRIFHTPPLSVEALIGYKQFYFQTRSDHKSYKHAVLSKLSQYFSEQLRPWS